MNLSVQDLKIIWYALIDAKIKADEEKEEERGKEIENILIKLSGNKELNKELMQEIEE